MPGSIFSTTFSSGGLEPIKGIQELEKKMVADVVFQAINLLS